MIATMYLRVAGRFKWPVLAGDSFEIWHHGARVAEFDAALVLDVLSVELRRARLGRILAAQPIGRLETERLSLPVVSHESLATGQVSGNPDTFSRAARPALPPVPSKPPAKITAAQRATYRAQRKRRARRAS